MSHVAEIALEIKDLSALKQAVSVMGGLEFRENQATYRWYGKHMGDYPLPAGFKKEDLGRCEHAISVAGNDRAYEVGVVKRRDGKPGYVLLYDFFAGGYGLVPHVGKNAERLCNHYGAQVAAKRMRQKGFRVNISEANGKVVATCNK